MFAALPDRVVEARLEDSPLQTRSEGTSHLHLGKRDNSPFKCPNECLLDQMNPKNRKGEVTGKPLSSLEEASG